MRSYRSACSALMLSAVLASGLSVISPALARDSHSEQAAATAAGYKKVLDSAGPALVTIKFVMKIEGGGEGFGEGGRDVETAGVMIEPAGLVLVSNAKMGGTASRMGMTVNPTNIKVLVGDDAEGVKARILARDSELDLCWIQIEDDKAKDKKFTSVDFAAGSGVEIGDRVLFVDRMGKFFDHALSIREGRIGGKTKKPRALMIPTGVSGMPDRRDLLGTPLFGADGKVVGFNILQLPDKEDMEGGDAGEGSFSILMLPASEVAKATIRGKELAAKQPKEEPKEAPKAESPKTDEKPAEKPVEPKAP
ncbi:MAG: serine protease [Phycisphaerales bacterium]|nr:serine protease [Phycisphaerales bacterium]